MRFARIAIGLSCTLLLATAALGGGFENIAVGSKARAMGGAFRSIADDWTAAYYNPAGFAYALDNQVGVSWAFVHNRHEYIPDYRFGGDFSVGIQNDEPLYNYHAILSNPSAGFIVRLPVAGETVFSLSAYQPFDYTVEWELYQPLRAYNDSVNLPNDQYYNNLDVVAFQLSAAKTFKEDKLALGIGLQLLRGDLIFKNIVFRENPAGAIDPALVDRPYDKIPEFNSQDGSGWGFGLRGGLLYKLTDNTNLGVAAAYPLKLTIKGTTENSFYMPNNPTLWHNHPDQWIAIPGYIGNMFAAGETILVSGDSETELKLPASFGLGLSHHFGEKLLFSLDVEYTLWSEFEGFDFTYSNLYGVEPPPSDTNEFRRDLAREFFSAEASYPMEWDNTTKFMIGAKYDLKSYISLLGGYTFDQSPIKDDVQFAPLFVDTGDKSTLSGGFILHIDRWDLGFVGSYTSMPDLDIPVPDDFGAGENTVLFPGSYKGSTYETVFSFNYRY
jgi:long-chain fatty acid transport protein